jgi:hypothetical protein
MKKIVLCLFVCFGIPVAQGQTLITDINQSRDGASSEAPLLEPGFVELQGQVYTMATDGSGFDFYKYENNDFVKIPNTAVTTGWYSYKIIHNKVYFNTVESKNGEQYRPLYEFDGARVKRIYVAADSTPTINRFSFGAAAKGVYIRDSRRGALRSNTMYYYENGRVRKSWPEATFLGSTSDSAYFQTLGKSYIHFAFDGQDSVRTNMPNASVTGLGTIGDTLFFTTRERSAGGVNSIVLHKYINGEVSTVSRLEGNLTYQLRQNTIMCTEYFTNRKYTMYVYKDGNIKKVLDTTDIPNPLRVDDFSPNFTTDGKSAFFTSSGPRERENIYRINLTSLTIDTLYKGIINQELAPTNDNELLFQAYDKTQGSDIYKTSGSSITLLNDSTRNWTRFYNGAVIGDTLFYNTIDIGQTPSIGNEPHKLSLTPKTSTNSINKTNTHRLTLYPNPAANTITLRTSVAATNVEVYTITGQKLPLDIQHNTLNISPLQAGAYYIKARLDDTTVTAKFIKK